MPSISKDKQTENHTTMTTGDQDENESDNYVATAKTMRPPCLLKHIVRGDILEALNHHSSQRGDVMITDLAAVVDELANLGRGLAPGACLGFPIDVTNALQQRIVTCDHRLDFPISKAEILMTINGHSQFDPNQNRIITDVKAVVETLKSLNRPISPSAFCPIGFQKQLQDAILREVKCIDDPNMQFPIQPNPTFLDAPPTIQLWCICIQMM